VLVEKKVESKKKRGETKIGLNRGPRVNHAKKEKGKRSRRTYGTGEASLLGGLAGGTFGDPVEKTIPTVVSPYKGVKNCQKGSSIASSKGHAENPRLKWSANQGRLRGGRIYFKCEKAIPVIKSLFGGRQRKGHAGGARRVRRKRNQL